MKAFVRTLTRRSLGDLKNETAERDTYWLSKTHAERIEAVGLINLTIHGEKYAEQKFFRVCKITRGRRG